MTDYCWCLKPDKSAKHLENIKWEKVLQWLQIAFNVRMWITGAENISAKGG